VSFARTSVSGQDEGFGKPANERALKVIDGKIARIEKRLKGGALPAQEFGRLNAELRGLKSWKRLVEERLAKLLYVGEGLHPQQIFLEDADESLGAAVTLRLPDERRRALYRSLCTLLTKWRAS